MASKKVSSAVAIGLLLASGSAALADYGRNSNSWWGSWGINARQHSQDHRIDNGRRNGSLTQHEYLMLKREQDRIAEMERRAKADGHLSNHERLRIQNAQRAARNHITHQTNDRQRAGWNHGWR